MIICSLFLKFLDCIFLRYSTALIGLLFFFFFQIAGLMFTQLQNSNEIK